MPVRRTAEGALSERVARALLGAPTTYDAETGTQRYQDISLNLTTGRLFDLEEEVSLTHLDLIRRCKILENGQAEAWLEQNVTRAPALPLPAEYVNERALIGLLAMRPELMAAIEEDVTVDHFGEPIHKKMFAAISELPFVPGSPISMQALMDAAGGDAKLPVLEGYTLAHYVAMLIAEAPSAPDAAHLARTLAGRIRSDANREGDVYDEADLEPEPAPFVSQMGLKMWADQDQPGAQYDYLIEDLIPERQVVVLMGDTGTGKSFLTFSLAMALARGVSFFGRRILKPVGVVWCAYEAAEGAGSRMRAYRHHHGLSLDPLPFAALQQPVPLWPNEPNGNLLINEVLGIERGHFGGIQIGAIVVDTYNAATPGASEIDSEVVSRIRSYFRRAVAETGAALIIVGHTNSSGKHRGNEQLTNNVDTILKVSFKTRIDGREIIQLKDDDGREIRTLKVIKQREGKNGDEFDFVLHAVKDGTINKFGSARTSCVIVPFEGTASAGAAVPKGPRLTLERRVILQALKTAIEDHGEPTPGVLKLPRSISRVVNARRWKEVYVLKNPEVDAPDNTVNKRLRDASAQFQHLGIIGRTNPFVWLAGKATVEELLSSPSDQQEFPEDF